VGAGDIISPVVNGSVLLSAGDLSGCEWPTNRVNPIAQFQSLKPTESIDYAVFVYRGKFQVNQAAALSRAQKAYVLLAQGKPADALALAREAVAVDPQEITSQTALGDISAALGQKDEARKAWQSALALAKQYEPDAQVAFVPDLEGKLKKL
jgi:tetratricopeptide (TPR) repeat protein